MSQNPDIENVKLLATLEKRSRELDCLYEVSRLTGSLETDPDDVFQDIIAAIPRGLQYPESCRVKIILDEKTYSSPDYVETSPTQSIIIKLKDKFEGSINVIYNRNMPSEDEGPFLKEERELINSVALLISDYVQRINLHRTVADMASIEGEEPENAPSEEWRINIDFLKRTDNEQYRRIARKMIVYLTMKGIIYDKGAIRTQQDYDHKSSTISTEVKGDVLTVSSQDKSIMLYDIAFDIASEHLTHDDITNCMDQWIRELKYGSYICNLANPDCSIQEVIESIRYFHHISHQDFELPDLLIEGAIVHMIRHFLSDQLEFIKVSRDLISIHDFHRLIPKIIYPHNSHGKLGNKGSDLFLASCILSKELNDSKESPKIRIPKTWYITSDGLYNFMRYNDLLNELSEQKYKDIEQIRIENPFVIQLFNNSSIPTWLKTGLFIALEEFGNSPLIVRSSSLLENRIGLKFSGQYKWRMLANKGTKQENLEALIDAVVEVYASTFGPEPLSYRAEQGLIDFNEEMGILIQEVVGMEVGKYYIPALSGIACVKSKYRRATDDIKQEDALIEFVLRLCMGDVDYIDDTYHLKINLMQSDLKIRISRNVHSDHFRDKINVINLEKNETETIDDQELIRTYYDNIKGIDTLTSILGKNRTQASSKSALDSEDDYYDITLKDGVHDLPFIDQIRKALETLKEAIESPVEIDFAFDGKDINILQCRFDSCTPG